MPVCRSDRAGRRRKNHDCLSWATGRRALLGAAMAALLAPQIAHAQSDENPLVQRGVPAEATAENAVVARDRALAAGQRLAYERMAAATGLPARLSDSQIEALVQSLIIESERITPRGYTARITVNFNPQRVAAMASGRGAAEAGASPAAPAPRTGPPIAHVEALATFRSLPEYIEISRRLAGAPVIARTEVLGISGEAARLRLSLRSPPNDAAAELGQAGLAIGPAGFGAQPEGWRLALAGFR
jgi:hypothetical protein